VTGAPHGARAACTSDGSACGGACDGVDPTGCAYPGDSVQCRAPSCTDGTAILAAYCQGDGACPAEQTQACAPYDCAGNLCGGDCTVDEDCDATHYCSAGVCVPRLEVGAPCAADTQCAGGFCVDGYCCDDACDGQCEACDVADHEGTCRPVAGAPHGGRDACAGTGPCAASCDGTDPEACAFPDETTVCSAPSCDAGATVAAGVCNGLGDCAVPDPVDCAPYVCADDACLDTCDGDEDCAAGYVCGGDACVPATADADADAETDVEADAEADAAPEADGEMDGVADGTEDGDAAETGGGEGCGCRAAGDATPAGRIGLLPALGLLPVRRRRRV